MAATKKPTRRVKCAHIKKNGDRCNAWAKSGSQRCATHARMIGEMTRFQPGPLHPNFKHGRYSKTLPSRMQDDYASVLADPNILNQTAEMAVMTAIIEDRIEKAVVGESSQTWKKLQSTAKKFQQARAAKDRDRYSYLLDEMLTLIEKGVGEYAAWDDVQKAMLNKAKLSDTERRRMKDEHQYLTSQQALIIFHRLGETIQRWVPDKTALREINKDILLLSQQFSGAHTTGDILAMDSSSKA